MLCINVTKSVLNSSKKTKTKNSSELFSSDFLGSRFFFVFLISKSITSEEIILGKVHAEVWKVCTCMLNKYNGFLQ